jgi:hypothetical protein
MGGEISGMNGSGAAGGYSGRAFFLEKEFSCIQNIM